MNQSRPKFDQNSFKHRPRSDQNQSKFDQNSILEGSWGHLGSCVAPGADLIPKTWFVGPPWAPKLGSKIGPRSTQYRSQTQPFWLTFLGSISEPSWGRFWSDLGVQNWSKIGPKSSSRAIRKQMQKSLKTISFYNTNGSPGGSKIDQKSMKNGSENDHNLSCQNNTQKVVNIAPKVSQNGAQGGSQID